MVVLLKCETASAAVNAQSLFRGNHERKNTDIAAFHPFTDPQKTSGGKDIAYRTHQATAASGTVATLLTTDLHGF